MPMQRAQLVAGNPTAWAIGLGTADSLTPAGDAVGTLPQEPAHHHTGWAHCLLLTQGTARRSCHSPPGLTPALLPIEVPETNPGGLEAAPAGGTRALGHPHPAEPPKAKVRFAPGLQLPRMWVPAVQGNGGCWCLSWGPVGSVSRCMGCVLCGDPKVTSASLAVRSVRTQPSQQISRVQASMCSRMPSSDHG